MPKYFVLVIFTQKVRNIILPLWMCLGVLYLSVLVEDCYRKGNNNPLLLYVLSIYTRWQHHLTTYNHNKCMCSFYGESGFTPKSKTTLCINYAEQVVGIYFAKCVFLSMPMGQLWNHFVCLFLNALCIFNF